MSFSIGLNGFGRIGRCVFRAAIAKGLKVSAINNPLTDVNYLLYQLKYDTIHGRLNVEAKKISDSEIEVNGQRIQIYRCLKPEDIKWQNVDYLMECSGIFLSTEQANKHIKGGAKKVILSAPPKDETPLFVYGVNHKTYKKEINVISNASCTTNCLAPLAKIVNDNYGIVEGLMTTIHASTATQLVVDGNAIGGKDWRAGRAAAGNIIPSSTGAAKAVGKVIPALKGKLTGMSMRVPTLNVSVVDVTLRLEKEASYEEICNKVKTESEGEYKGVVGWTDEEVVSSDFNHDCRSSILDIKAGISLNNKFVKLVSWYDNEWGYSNRMVDLVNYMHSVDSK